MTRSTSLLILGFALLCGGSILFYTDLGVAIGTGAVATATAGQDVVQPGIRCPTPSTILALLGLALFAAGAVLHLRRH